MDIKNIREDFEIFKNKGITYLDSAATSQKPKYVLDKINEYYTTFNSNVHRGAYSLSVESTEKYDLAREKVSQFINSKHKEEVIFTKNATEALNLIAYSYGMQSLTQNEEVVLSIMEHHSNLVPWQRVAKLTHSTLKYMYINEDFIITDEEIESKITDKTKIVCVTHVSNVLGTINNIEKIIKYAHKKGAKVVVDASQSIGHIKIDVEKLDADFLVFSGHKMMAPLGIGVLYAKKELLNKMPPFLMGGDMIEYVYEQETTYATLPNKFEAGTQNVEGAIGLLAAIEYMEKIGYENIEKIEKEVVGYAVDELSKLDFLTLYIPKNRENHCSVISFNVNGVHPHDVASILDSYNVCVRSGNHCAQPLLRFLGLDSTLRASFYIYNTKEDVDNLVKGLKKAHEMFSKYLPRSK